jgi:hypothetical protein
MTGPQAIAEVKRLSPQNGDVLVFHVQKMNALDRQTALTTSQLASDMLRRQGVEVVCVVLFPEQSLELLDEDAMRSAGWVRIP